jgi:hypothetical protein
VAGIFKFPLADVSHFATEAVPPLILKVNGLQTPFVTEPATTKAANMAKPEKILFLAHNFMTGESLRFHGIFSTVISPIF